jgi:hypothetical protein
MEVRLDGIAGPAQQSQLRMRRFLTLHDRMPDHQARQDNGQTAFAGTATVDEGSRDRTYVDRPACRIGFGDTLAMIR